MDIRQSDLASYSRCAKQKHYKDLAKQGLHPQPATLSATAYGSVVHHAVRTLEELVYAEDPQALDVALATFAHYWNPDNIAEVPGVSPVDIWLPRQTYAGLLARGLKTIRDYHSLLMSEKGDVKLLGLEVTFRVPLILPGTREVDHVLTGTLDRLAIRFYKRKPYLSIEDFKTGKQPTYLRYNAQFTTYCYATTQPDFWTLWPDAVERWKRYEPLARRGTWIDLQNNKRVDAGWRAEADYQRLLLALTEYVNAVDAESYPLTLSGETCLYCPFRETCGGVAVPEELAGAPA